MKLYVKRGEYGEFQKAKMEFDNLNDWVSFITALRLAKGLYRDKAQETTIPIDFLEQVEEAYTENELTWNV